MGKITNSANLMSILRIGFVPVFLAVLFQGFTTNNMFLRVWAILLFGLICGTDVFDGIVARKFNQTSRIGEWLDLTADLIFLLATYSLLFVVGIAPVWMIALILMKFLDYVVTSHFLKSVAPEKLFVHDLIGRTVIFLYIVTIGAILVNGLFEFELLNDKLIRGTFLFLLVFSLFSSVYRIWLVLVKRNVLYRFWLTGIK